MKKLKAVLVLCAVLSQSLWAMDINSTLSGSWYNPLQDGHGLSVEVLTDNRTVIYWFVYNPDGTPTFLITVGQNNGASTSGDTYVQSGMKFGDFDPDDVTREVWGTVTLSFQDCDTAQLDYSSTDEQFGSGSIPMTRLVSIDALKCKDNPLHGNYSISRAVRNEESGEVVTTTGTALLFENGDMTYMLGTETFGFGIVFDLVAFGSWSTPDGEPGSFEYNATSYSWSNQGATQVSGSGFHHEDGFKTMDDEFTDALTATLLPSFQNGLSTQIMAGTYLIAETDVVIGEAHIAADGTITGNMDDCGLDGSIVVPDTDFNQASFDLNVLDCETSGHIIGSVLYDHRFGSLTLIGTNTSKGFVLFFVR